MIKQILAALAITTASILPVEANTVTHQQHNELWMTLESIGVEMFVNDPDLCKDSWGGGSYLQLPDQRRSAIVVCQNNGKGQGEGNFVAWTPNDYDTLRHEAHHVVQDCIDGVRADKEMGLMFEGQEHTDFVTRSLSRERIQRIIKGYGEDGASRETILLELEAFSVAEEVSPINISDALKRLCS